MSEYLKNSSLKKRVCLTGAICAGILLVLPAVAQSSANASAANFIAQTTPGGESQPETTSPVTPAEEPTPSAPQMTTPTSPTPGSGSGTTSPAREGTTGRPTPGTNTSTQGSNYSQGTWLCLNNPNPGCGNPMRK